MFFVKMKKNHSFNNNIPSFSDYFFLLRLQSYAPSTVNLLFFDCKLTLLRFYWTIRLVILNFSFAFTAPLLWFYWNAEPSTLTRRAFAIETPKARYRNDEPSATSWIQRIGSVNPLMCDRQSSKVLHQKHSFVALLPFPIACERTLNTPLTLL